MKIQTQVLFNKVNEIMTLGTIALSQKTSINQQPKTFGAIDMWNIQRRKKTLVIR